MTEIEFFEKVHQKYKEANELIEGNGGFNVKRGMSHTMSSYLEDLFALFVAKKINRDDLLYYVDKVFSIRFRENERAQSFKPDLMILDNNRLSHFFDLKSNLGYKRDARIYLEEKNRLMERLHGKAAWIREKNDKTVQHITISKNLIYHMVVVFGGNINEQLMNANIEIADTLEFVKVDILHKKRKVEEHSAINFDAFSSIYQSLGINK